MTDNMQVLTALNRQKALDALFDYGKELQDTRRKIEEIDL